MSDLQERLWAIAVGEFDVCAGCSFVLVGDDGSQCDECGCALCDTCSALRECSEDEAHCAVCGDHL